MNDRNAAPRTRPRPRRAPPAARRGALLALPVLAAACAPGDGPAPDPEPATPSGPNVVLIVMETTRADRCSLLGYDRPTTPALDALAAEATVFERAFAPAPWTAPSHASLFTGLRPEQHGLRGDAAMNLSDRHVTLAEHLRDAGYATAGFTTNPFVTRDFGLAQGFETFQEIFREPDLPYPHAPLVNGRALAAARAARDARKPFFVFLNHMEPHLPYTPPEDLQAGFVDPGVDAARLARVRAFRYPGPLAHNLGVERLPDEDLALLSDVYDAEIATLDREIGAFVESLRAEGLLDDTLLVIASDHGENLGEHDLVDHMFSVHHALLHVPLMIRYPGGADGGTRVEDPVQLQDVFPTVLEACGLPVPDDLQSASLRGDVGGRTPIGRFGRPTTLLKRAQENYPQADTSDLAHTLWSVHSGSLHLIRSEAGWMQLFDYLADPLETNDLAPARPQDAARLRALLPPSAR